MTSYLRITSDDHGRTNPQRRRTMTTNHADTAPEVAEDAFETAPGTWGALDQQEIEVLGRLTRESDTLVRRLGQLTVQKAQILGTLQNKHNQSQVVLQQIGTRLEIPVDANWTITAEGVAVTLPQKDVPG